MSATIDSYLKRLSYKYYLKKNSSEIEKINRSIGFLLSSLDNQLGSRIKSRFIFGSYDRDTILPRSIDQKSDVDLMVVFKHSDYERTPETYRNWLKNFADINYKNRYGSSVIKTFPTVTIKLNNIHFDLVPAKEDYSFLFRESYFIPNNRNGWQETEPEDVKDNLTRANTRYNQIVRPIIRLLKAWNCTKDYPYDSYELELEITDMNFSGDNIQSGFFYAVDKLDTSWNDPQIKKTKLESLKYNIEKVQEYLESEEIERAKKWLMRVLP